MSVDLHALIPLIALSFLLAGFVKGVVGLGLPTVSVGLLGLAMPPMQAAALLIVPSMVTNLWQLACGPRFLGLMKKSILVTLIDLPFSVSPVIAGLIYGVVLCTARAMGEFGAVSVVSGHIRGVTNTLPLHVEILYNEYNHVAAFSVASLLLLMALVILLLKQWSESRMSRLKSNADEE